MSHRARLRPNKELPKMQIAKNSIRCMLMGMFVLTLSEAVNAQVPLPWIARSQLQAAPTGSHWADATDFQTYPSTVNPANTIYENQNPWTGSFITISVDPNGRGWVLVTSELWGLIVDTWFWSGGGGWVDENGNYPPNPRPLT